MKSTSRIRRSSALSGISSSYTDVYPDIPISIPTCIVRTVALIPCTLCIC